MAEPAVVDVTCVWATLLNGESGCEQRRPDLASAAVVAAIAGARRAMVSHTAGEVPAVELAAEAFVVDTEPVVLACF